MDHKVMEPRLADEESMRLRKVVVRFLRWHGAKDVEDVASETVVRFLHNRGAGEEIENPEAYLRQIARNVLKEQHRNRQREAAWVRDPLAVLPAASTDAAEILSRRLDYCKRTCLLPDEIDVIEAYYGGDPAEKIDRRKALAANMGVNENALRIRAFRLRQKLFNCMKGCEEVNFGGNDSQASSLSNKRDARG